MSPLSSKASWIGVNFTPEAISLSMNTGMYLLLMRGTNSLNKDIFLSLESYLLMA